MPTSLTDVDVFTSPIVIPADGDDIDESVHTPGFQGLANRTHHLKVVADGLEGANHNWTGQHTFAMPINHDAPHTHTSEINLHGAVDGTGSHVVSWTNDGQVVVPVAGAIDIRIPFKVPAGITITDVNAYVFTGGAGFTLSLKLMKRANFVTAQLGATHTLAGVTAGSHALGVSSLSEVATDDAWYWLVITSTDTTGSGSIDGALVAWQDPGPRTAVV